MTPEFDEYGILIKRTSKPTAETDEYGIPIKKKENRVSLGSVGATAVDSADTSQSELQSSSAQIQTTGNKSPFGFKRQEEREGPLPANIKRVENIISDVVRGDVDAKELSSLYNTDFGKPIVDKLIGQYDPESGGFGYGQEVFRNEGRWDNLAKKIKTENRKNGVAEQDEGLARLDSTISTSLSSLQRTIDNRDENNVLLFSDNKPLPLIDLNDSKKIGEAIEFIKGADYLSNGKGETVSGAKETLLKDLSIKYKHLKGLEEIPEEINALSPKIEVATTRYNLDRERGEKTNVQEYAKNDSLNSEHFKVGLNYLKDINPGKYKNVIRAIEQKEQVPDTDFENVAAIGQQLSNDKIYRQAASDPNLIDKETDLNYKSYQTKKSEYALAIGELAKKSGITGREFSPSVIKKLASAAGLENKEIINDLADEEGMLGYDAIPKSGTVEAFARGIIQPFSSIGNTLDDISNNTATNYAKSQQLDVGMAQKVANKKGEYSGELPSERSNIWYDVIEGFGQFIPQVLLTKGIGGAAAGVIGADARIALSAAQKSNITNYGGTFISTYMQEYGGAYEDALQKTGDPATAKAMGAINGMSAAAFELILPDVKIAERASSLMRGKYAKDIVDLVRRANTKGGIATDYLNEEGKGLITSFVKETLDVVGQEVSEEVGTNLVNYLTESIFSPKTAKDRDLGNELFETAKATAISMLIPAVLGGAGASTTKSFTINGFNAAAINLEDSRASLKRALVDENITQDEYNKSIKLLETHKNSINESPEVKANGTELTGKERIDYAYQETQIKINKEKATQTEGVQKEVFESKIKAAEDIQRAILIPKDNESVVDAGTNVIPVSETTETVQPLTDGAIQTDEEREAAITTELGEEKTNAAIAQVKELVDNDLIPETVSPADKELAEKHPLSFLQFVAQQAQGEINLGDQVISSRPKTIETFGEGIVAAAEDVFPNLQSIQNEETQTDQTKESEVLNQSEGAATTVAPSVTDTIVDYETLSDENAKEVFIKENTTINREAFKSPKEFIEYFEEIRDKIKKALESGDKKYVLRASGMDRRFIEKNMDDAKIDKEYANTLKEYGLTEKTEPKSSKSVAPIELGLDISNKKVDIERRRQSELDNVPIIVGATPEENQSTLDMSEAINAKYDAELAAINEKSTQKEIALGEPTITEVEDGSLHEWRTKDGLIAGVLTSPTEFRIDGISAAEVGKGQGTAMFESLIEYLRDKGVKTLTTKSAGEGAIAMHNKAVEKGLLSKIKSEGRTASFNIEPIGKDIKTTENNQTTEEKSIAAKGKELADRIRKLKSKPKADVLQANVFGVGVSLYNTSIDIVAQAVEQGAKLADAIARGVEYIKTNYGESLNEEDYVRNIEDRVRADLKSKEDLTEYLNYIEDVYFNKHGVGRTSINSKMIDFTSAIDKSDLSEGELREAVKKSRIYSNAKNKIYETIADRGKRVAKRIRDLKSPRDIAQSNIFGIPVAIYDGVLETIATAVENGAKLVDAIQEGIKSISAKNREKFDEAGFTKHIESVETVEKPKVRVTAEQVKAGQPKTERQKQVDTIANELRTLLGDTAALEGIGGQRVTLEQLGITENDTIPQVIDKLIAHNGQFSELLNFVKGVTGISDVKFKIAEAYAKKIFPTMSGQYFFNNKANQASDRKTVEVVNPTNAYYTITHEILHWLTVDSDIATKGDKAKLKRLENIFTYLKGNKGIRQFTNITYGLSDFMEFMVELMINPDFRNYISDISVGNESEFQKGVKAEKGYDSKNILQDIYDVVKEFFERIFNTSDYAKIEANKPLVDQAVQLATDLFFSGNNVIEGQKATGQKGFDISPSKQQRSAAALPNADKNKILSDYVKNKIAEGVSPDVIKEGLLAYGLSEEEASNIVDDNSLSGIKKALVSDEIIAGVDLDKIGDKDMMALGRKIIETGEVKPESLVTKIISDKSGVLAPKEVVAMITYKADIDAELRNAYKEANKRQEAGQDLGTLSVEISDLERKINDFDVAAVITAQQQSMAFRLRKMMLDRDYNVVKQIEKYKKVNNGEIPADVERRFREMDKELKELKEKISVQEKAKQEKEEQAAVDNIQDSVAREKKYTDEELEKKVKEGVQTEINNIYQQLAPEKKSLANKAIAALENIQKKLRSRTYDAGLGIPAAIIDAGITTIKNAIKLGVNVQRAVELGISEIKKRIGNKQWDKEADFRKDMIDGFEGEGVSTSNKKKDTATINEDGTVSIPNQMLRDLVERGITDINDLTDTVHEIVSQELPDITKRQVRDYITDYGKTVNPTADDLQRQVNVAKRIGRLLSELEDVQNGKKKTTNPATKAKLTDQEKELKRKIKALSKDIPITDEEKENNLSKAKERVRQRIKDLENRIKNEDFARKKKLAPVNDEELVRLNSEKEKIQEEFDNAQYQNELKNRTFWQKAEDVALEIISAAPRALVASIDFSAPFVQGVWRLFSSPIRSARAFGNMIEHFWSEKRQEDWENRLKAQPFYPLLQASKLAITNKEGKASVKEGLFISNWVNLAYNGLAKVLTLGYKPAYDFAKKINLYKASQRAFDGYVNSIRVQSFLGLAKQLEKSGYTYESDPKVYEKAADFVNTTTGRATLGGAEQSSKWLNLLLFAPRKVMSEIKLFTPYAFIYYAKMPPAVRKRALLDFATFVTSFVGTNALLWASRKDWGDDDDDDDNFWNMNSSDFMTHKFGSQRVGFGGGAKTSLVFMSRLINGKFTDQYGKTTNLGDRFGKQVNTRLDLIFRFLLGKAAPAVSVASKKLDERKGLEVDDAELVKNLTVPIWMQDAKSLYKDNPAAIGGMFTALSILGANVRTVDASKKSKSETFKIYSPTIKSSKGVREATPEEYKKYTKDRDKKAEEKIKAVEKRGTVWLNKYGELTISEDDKRSVKKYTDLTEEEIKDLEQRLKAQAANEVKKTFKF